MQVVSPMAQAAPAGVRVRRSSSLCPASQSWQLPGTGSVAPVGHAGAVDLLKKAVRCPLKPGRSKVGCMRTGAVVLNRLFGLSGLNVPTGATKAEYSKTLSTTPGEAANVPEEAASAIAWLSASTSWAVLLATKAFRQVLPGGQVAAVAGGCVVSMIAPDPPWAITFALAGAIPTPKATTKTVAWCWGSVGSASKLAGRAPGFVL